MEVPEHTLHERLLDIPQGAPEIERNARQLIIRPHGSDIIFSFSDTRSPGSPTVALPPSRVSRLFFMGTLGFVMITKCVASSGMMVFAERDLLENEHYIFWKILFRHFPEFAVDSIIACTVFSDTIMNLVTRGSATAKMLRGLLYGHRDPSAEPLLSGTCSMQMAKSFIMFCGGLSSVTASLVAFLGAVTLGHYATNNIYGLMAWGSMVAIANFVVNISYRIDRSVDNFVRVINGELRFTAGHLLISAIGSAAFLGQCYYGTDNAIRKLLALLKVYAGEPESGLGVIFSYENWINGATDATLPFAIVSYFFASCVPMFEPKAIIPDGHYVVPLKQVLKFVGTLKTTQYYRTQRYFDRDYLYLEALQLFCVTLMPFFVISTMLGSVLPTFNSSNGLIIHLFFGSQREFNHIERLIVALMSLLLTVVFSKIFWNFNVVDWFCKVEELWVSEAMRVMQRAELYHPDEGIDGLQRRLERVAEPEPVAAPGCWADLWSRYAPVRWQSEYEALEASEEAGATSPSTPLRPS